METGNLQEHIQATCSQGPASFLMLKRDDGVFFMPARVAEIRVKTGDKLESQVVAQVGNNGYSRYPHIYIGA